MDPRLKKSLLIATLVVIVVIFVWAVASFFIRFSGQNKNVSGNVATTETAPQPADSADTQTGTETVGQPAGLQVDEQGYTRQLAGIVVERFGTYSNHASGQNIEDIEPFLSIRGKRWAVQYTPTEAASTQGEYSGVTTKVASSEFSEWIPGVRAVVLVHAHRAFQNSSGETGTQLQDMEVVIKKTDGQWLVDEIRFVKS
ncbi:MAG TPA: hypothetical protein DDW36_00120 [Candidatus Magasanikbacteria bacterium]|nr:hypothetical protein [Candidatus Magasanikbacteria bacterium]